MTFDWTAQAGTSTLMAVTDSNLEVAEANEGNNELTITYKATTFVDLTVQEVTWDPTNPSVGDDVTFSVIVRNLGSLDAAESAVELSGLPTEESEFVVENQLVSIPAGGGQLPPSPGVPRQGHLRSLCALTLTRQSSKAMRTTMNWTSRTTRLRSPIWS